MGKRFVEILSDDAPCCEIRIRSTFDFCGAEAKFFDTVIGIFVCDSHKKILLEG